MPAETISTSGDDFNYQIALDASGLGFVSPTAAATATSGLPLNSWTHVAGTFDGSTFTIYINGTLADTGTGTGTLGSVNNTSLRIGTSGTCQTKGEAFGGQLDEVSIYNRALSATEIQSIFNAGSEGKATIVVNTSADTTDADPNITSLREAITASNASTGDRDVIGFDIPTPPLGAISHWPAEKDANDTVDGNHGTVMNGATFGPGILGQAFSFDGVDDTVRVAHNANLDPGTGSFAVSTFIKTSQIGAPVIVSKYECGEPTCDQGGGEKATSVYALELRDGVLFGLIRDMDEGGPDGSGAHVVLGVGSLADGVFHHVAMVRDVTAGVVNLVRRWRPERE